MADSITEQIRQNMIETLQGVNVAAGYRTTLRVEDGENTSEERRDGLCVVLPDPPEPMESPLGWQQWSQVFRVVVFLHRSETSQNAIRTRLNNAIADIYKAVKVDPTRGDLAIHTYIDESPEMTVDGEFDRIVAMPRVMFRHLINNPFSQG